MLWPLSVVLVANTNVRLAIPALAGLLVIYEHDQILIYEHKCQRCSPIEFLPKKPDVCVIDTFRLLVLNYYYNYNYYYYCTTLFCKAHNISNRHKSNVPRWQQ